MMMMMMTATAIG